MASAAGLQWKPANWLIHFVPEISSLAGLQALTLCHTILPQNVDVVDGIKLRNCLYISKLQNEYQLKCGESRLFSN